MFNFVPAVIRTAARLSEAEDNPAARSTGRPTKVATHIWSATPERWRPPDSPARYPHFCSGSSRLSENRFSPECHGPWLASFLASAGCILASDAQSRLRDKTQGSETTYAGRCGAIAGRTEQINIAAATSRIIRARFLMRQSRNYRATMWLFAEAVKPGITRAYPPQ
jgi:hypothetical protein